MRWASKLFVENIIELLEEIDFFNFKKIKRNTYSASLKVTKIEIPFILRIEYIKDGYVTEENIRDFFIDINTVKIDGKPVFIGYPGFTSKAIEVANSLNITTLNVDEILSNLVDTTLYREKLFEQKKSLEDNFFSVNLISENNNTVKLSVFTKILTSSESYPIIVKGETGSGKTTLLKYILFNEYDDNNFLPIFIDFKDYKSGSLYDFIISNGLKKNNIKIKSEKIFHILCREKKIIFLFDNLDYLVNINSDDSFYKEFERLISTNTPILFTADDNFITNNYHSNHAIYRVIALFKPKIFTIAHLTFSDIKKKIKGQNIQKIFDNKNLSELVKLPIFFDIITKISLTDDTVINKPIDIYKEALKQWNTSYLTPLGKATICEEMARVIINKGYFDSKKDIPDFIESFINNEYKAMPFSTEFLNKDLEKSFFIKKLGPNTYTFIHSSFTYFFLAKKLVEEIRRGNYNNINLLSSKFILDFVEDYLGYDKIMNILIEKYTREKYPKDRGDVFYLMYKVSNHIGIDSEIPIVRISLQKIDLISREFNYLKISSADLRETILKSADFKNCKCTNIDFTASNMEKVVVSESEFKSSTFNMCSMKFSNIIKSNLSNSSFHKANLFQSKIIKSNLSFSNFNASNLHGVIGCESIFKKCDIRKSDISNCDFAKAVFTETTFEEINSKSVSFCYSDLASVTIRDSKFPFSFFHNTDLSSSSFFNVKLEAVNLYGSIFENANLNGVSFKFSNLMNASFKNAVLKNVDFEGADIRGVDFTGVKMCEDTKESIKKAIS
ncbi:MAG TPA: pentapeptide repeat-containing protein [Spirochaetota bacterium]|nr:pentapeptide repeat-containing protein [Spirochaetota bacterium]